VRTGSVYCCGLHRAHSRRHLLPNSPDIRSKLPIRHFDSVELKRLPNLVHRSAAVQACLNLRPRPHNPSALGPWSGLRQRFQVCQRGVRFSRSAAAVHGWILGRFAMNCNSVSAFCQQFVSSPDSRWSCATSCQQYVNNSFGTTTRRQQTTGSGT